MIIIMTMKKYIWSYLPVTLWSRYNNLSLCSFPDDKNDL